MTMSNQYTDESVSDGTTGDADGENSDAQPDLTPDSASESRKLRRLRIPRISWMRVFALGVLPAIVMALALCAGYAKWRGDTLRDVEPARIESVQAAKEGTAAILGYEPATVEKELNAARDRLTGDFRESYTSLINDMVIPGSKERQISAVADVPAAGVVSADDNRAVVLVFVNQTTTIGDEPPTNTASSVRVTLDKVDNRWLIAGFEPV